MKVAKTYVPFDAKTSKNELVARRASLSTTPQLFQEVHKVGWQRWLETQMRLPESVDKEFLDRMQTRLPISLMTNSEGRAFAAEKGIYWAGVAPHDNADRQRSGTTMLRAIFSKRHLNEAMSNFWLDFFSVPYDSHAGGPVMSIDLSVRKVALTSFPKIFETFFNDVSVYIFLNNDYNKKGQINENLGREILELYSVGVGNHTEQDVKQTSILLTGWSYSSVGELGFNSGNHEYTSSPLKILGRSFPNANETEARNSHAALLKFLSSHPDTMILVGRQMYQRFISDETPSQDWLNRFARIYQGSNGDVKSLLRYIFGSKEFDQSAGKKWKRPQEFAYATLRARDPFYKIDQEIRPDDPHAMYFWMPMHSFWKRLTQAGHNPRYWLSPNGYSDDSRYWISVAHNLFAFDLVTLEEPDPELIYQKTWTQVLNVNPNESVHKSSKILVRGLTGYECKDIEDEIAFILKNPLPKDDSWDNRVQKAVHMTLASPLGLLR